MNTDNYYRLHHSGPLENLEFDLQELLWSLFNSKEHTVNYAHTDQNLGLPTGEFNMNLEGYKINSSQLLLREWVQWNLGFIPPPLSIPVLLNNGPPNGFNDPLQFMDSVPNDGNGRQIWVTESLGPHRQFPFTDIMRVAAYGPINQFSNGVNTAEKLAEKVKQYMASDAPMLNLLSHIGSGLLGAYIGRFYGNPIIKQISQIAKQANPGTLLTGKQTQFLHTVTDEDLRIASLGPQVRQLTHKMASLRGKNVDSEIQNEQQLQDRITNFCQYL